LKLTFQISDIDTPLAEETEPAVQQEDDLAPPPVITCSLVVSKGSHENSLSIDLEAGEEGFAITNLAVFPKSLAEAEGSEGDWARRSRYLGPRMSIVRILDAGWLMSRIRPAG
jgi:complement component 1 Q subcomponent-binding protein